MEVTPYNGYNARGRQAAAAAVVIHPKAAIVIPAEAGAVIPAKAGIHVIQPEHGFPLSRE
jgi:hypothetical protein